MNEKNGKQKINIISQSVKDYKSKSGYAHHMVNDISCL